MVINIIYIIAAILIFGVLIFIHECGHYLFARIFKVSINEFAIGMGPKLISKTSKKTGIRYSLRLLPIGGFVSMVGEDEDSEDDGAFCNKPVWQRIIITAAGAVVNILAAVLVMGVLTAATDALGGTVVAEFIDVSESGGISSADYGLMEGDKIIRVNNSRVHISSELVYEIAHEGNLPVDLTVLRNGEKIVLKDVEFSKVTSEGVTLGQPDFRVYVEKKTPVTIIKHAFYNSIYVNRMIWESLYDLVTGRYGFEALSGPVKVTEVLAEAASQDMEMFVNLAVIISMNLGIMNLLPLPALDGGRIVFQIIELIRRKPINRNVEGYIHFAGIVLLMLLMLVITFKDVISLIR